MLNTRLRRAARLGDDGQIALIFRLHNSSGLRRAGRPGVARQDARTCYKTLAKNESEPKSEIRKTTDMFDIHRVEIDWGGRKL